jgi:RNA polymerase sigma-70 factor (ECF subfamily)
MYHLAFSILYDEDESKDVVSEVFAYLLKKDVVLRAETAEQFLLTSVRNQCCDVLRKKQVRERFFRLFSEEMLQQTVIIDDMQRMEELLRYVDGHLPPLSLQILRLRYLQEMTCQEVADTLGISRMTVHNHLRLSIEQIRKYFKTIAI